MSISIRLKHSASKDKAPVAADLAAGELALNTNVDSPAAYIKDSSGTIVKLAGAGAIGGTQATETALGIAEIATQAEVTAGLDDQRIVTPLKLAASQATASTQADARYVNVTGDNMTGDLTLGTDKITLKPDGSGTFAGSVKVEGACRIGDGKASSAQNTGVDIFNTGAINATGPVGQNPVFLAQEVGTNATTAKINANGSASFAGDFDLPGRYQNRSSDGFTAMQSSTSTLELRSTQTDGSVFSGLRVKSGCTPGDLNSGGTTTAKIGVDGSAEFTGNLELPGRYQNRSSDGKIVMQSSTSTLEVRSTQTDGSLFNGLVIKSGCPAGNLQAGGTTTAKIGIDGSAEFTGAVTATNIATSDARFKENITPAKPQLADVVALGGLLKNYDWNADAPVNEERRAQRQLGLVAQEAEQVCPGLVKTIARTKQGKELTPAVVDSNGVVTTDATHEELDDSYRGLSTDVIIMKLLGAVAELKAEVEALKTA